jgi:hypothetical protein
MRWAGWRHNALAHRVAYRMSHGGEVPHGLLVLHTCDNPACVRPAHLYAGTGADNTRDAYERGQLRPEMFAIPRKLTDEQVRDIRLRVLAGETQTAVADDYGVTPQYVGQLANRIWRVTA